MKKCVIELNGVLVGFNSSVDLVDYFKKISLIPHFWGLKVYPDTSYDKYLIVYKETSSEKIVRYLGNKVEIFAPWSSLMNGETLLYASLPFVELQLQEKNFVTIHAAGIKLSDKGILILGKEGAGKTMTTINLCKNHNAELIGNDLVVVGCANDGKLVLQSGTKFFHIRYESAKRNLPELIRFFPDNTNNDTWLLKTIINPLDLNIKTCDSPVSLKKIFLVHVDETKNDLIVKSADNLVNRLYLNENFSRYIRGTCISLFEENFRYLGYTPSFDSELLFQKRAKIMESFFSEFSMKFVSGSLERISEYIYSTI